MARDNVSEELLQLRKRARRRLIGAVTLVIFALIVLWTVLDGEPPAALTHPVEIIASAPSTSASAPAAALVTPALQLVASAPAQIVETPVAAEPLPGRLVNSQVEPSKAPTERPVIKPTEKPADKPRPTVALKPTAAPKPTRDPQRILEGLDEAEAKPADKPAAASRGGQVLVQIGAYGDKAKATDILGKLKANGIPAYAEPVNNKGVALTRIRIGPVDEARAKALVQKATALGYAPQLVH
ncbi:Cell division protein DedD [Andreprevotia sp. IGB-42]|uniref:SPOR domain-containing protein n=1 Tax=Andreprevotia sp. IGB-42 TaxID=2497473 RepID=UPI0013599C3D|nr:SPOR domain-containing protein [Andreprevotia sp. IGB-42]KAF0814999.1 Cell division protein DedD [Andreprevotia sp. IGB-42]